MFNNVLGGLKAETQSANSPFTSISMLKTNMCLFFSRFLTSIPKQGKERVEGRIETHIHFKRKNLVHPGKRFIKHFHF
jgi:hypothetical protein